MVAIAVASGYLVIAGAASSASAVSDASGANSGASKGASGAGDAPVIALLLCGDSGGPPQTPSGTPVRGYVSQYPAADARAWKRWL